MTVSKNTAFARLSIIIVNFNSGELLRNCIESICSNIDVDFEVIIYDNASSDESASSLNIDPRIRIISGKENLGFAKANNLAAKQATGEFLHFLNPDIIINKSLADEYKNILGTRKSAIYVTSLTDVTGNLQKNRHLIPRIGNIARYIMGSSIVAFWNLGASIIIQTEAFRKIGGWPEDYFMYVEDLDFFYIAHKYKIPVYYADTRLIHIGKGVTHQIWSDKQRAFIIEKSFKKFYNKYNAGWEYIIIRPIQMLYLLFNAPGSFPLYCKVFIQTLFKK
ncbi:MAG: glycosyltransferase family 2 protein [Bacteroidota bacterium]